MSLMVYPTPLGVPQQVILINGQFQDSKINCTSNNNIVVNVFNQLDEPFSYYMERGPAKEEFMARWSVGGYGPITIHSRPLIPVPFDAPEDDFSVLISDWYTKSHKTLKVSRQRTFPRKARRNHYKW
ncbi:hypothetical protein HAX54_026387 [Datura stramonium]|uniref:Plastocyanin-like domain-containing protein n=1 Tax=Datura stramonium TaxID=4076 RepID=A0ABS8RL09_DATST|nr:hypothetical protein [Datura stramonium]